MTATVRTRAPRTAVVPVAAPTALRGVVGGPATTTWTVIARRSAAVLLSDATGRDLLSLTTVRGSRTPQSLTLPAGTALPAGPVVVVGGAAEASHRVARWWDSSVPRIYPGPLPTVSADGGLSPRQLAPVLAAQRDWNAAAQQDGSAAAQQDGSAAAQQDGSAAALGAALSAVIGLGPGSTPSGDDLAAGVLTALHALGRADAAAEIFHHLGDLDRRTTPLSAALLRQAAAGHACAEILCLLRALDRRADPSAVPAAVRGVLALGATSGADLIAGLLPTLSTPTSSTPASRISASRVSAPPTTVRS